jgi:hypothetical protein
MVQDPSLKRSRSKFDLQVATNIALLAVTSLAAVVLVRDLFNGGSGTGATGPKAFAVDSAATANAGVGTVVGGAGREVRLLMFSDFQCPFCANYRHVIDSVLSDATLPVEVRLVHYPLSYHARAVEAAEFFECAAIDGAPSAAHDALFERQSLLDTLDLSALAGIVSPANPQFW